MAGFLHKLIRHAREAAYESSRMTVMSSVMALSLPNFVANVSSTMYSPFTVCMRRARPSMHFYVRGMNKLHKIARCGSCWLGLGLSNQDLELGVPQVHLRERNADEAFPNAAQVWIAVLFGRLLAPDVNDGHRIL